MQCAFVSNGNEPLCSTQRVLVRDLTWFKTKLREGGVCELHIVWNADEQFHAVGEAYMERYFHHRRKLSHRDALIRAKEDVDTSI